MYLLGLLGGRRVLGPLLAGMGQWYWTRHHARALDRLDASWRTSPV